MSSPTSFRLSEAALAALKVEESKIPRRPRGEIISQAIIAQAEGKNTLVVKFNAPSIEDIMLYRGAAAETATADKKLLATIAKQGRSCSKEATENLIEAAQAIKTRLKHLEQIDDALSESARRAGAMATTDDAAGLQSLQRNLPKWATDENSTPTLRAAFLFLQHLIGQ